MKSGEIISHYRLANKIGEGGMGEVWRAEDLRLDRQVALKVLHAISASDPERISRFRLEAKAVAALNHPSIVTLFDVETADGVQLLSMELVEGDALSAHLKDHDVPVSKLLEIALQLTDAVAAAHARGIVHRDLKPDNVMLSSEGRVKVLDFGLAKLREAGDEGEPDSSLAQTRTTPGMVMGTLNYMSPEQVQGQPVDARSDIFSIGVMLYEMCIGERPFSGENSAAFISSLLRDPTPSLTETHQVPAQLNQIIQRCLEKDPEKRFSSTRELHGELEAFQRALHSSENAASIGSESRPAASGRHSRGWIGAVAILLLIGTATVVWDRWKGSAPGETPTASAITTERSLAILPLVVAGDDVQSRSFAEGVQDDLILQASRIRALKTISRTTIARFLSSKRSIDELRDEFGVSAIIEGSVRRAGARIRVNVKLIDTADGGVLWGDSFDRELTTQNIFSIQTEIVEQVAAALETALSDSERDAISDAPTNNLDAYAQYQLGRALDRGAPATDNLAQKIDAYNAATSLDPLMAQAWARLSIAHIQFYWRGYDRSDERREMARSALERAAEIRPDIAEVLMARGYYHYWGFRNYSDALIAFEAAERELPNDASIIAVKSFIQRRMGRWDESLATLQLALELDPLNWYLIENLYNTLRWMRRWDEMFQLLNEAQRHYPEKLWIDHSRGLNYLLRDGDPAPLIEFLDRREHAKWIEFSNPYWIARDVDAGLKLADSMPDEPQEEQLFWRSKEFIRGRFLWLDARFDEARPQLLQAHDEIVSRTRTSPNDARLYATLGVTLALLGEREEALVAAQRAVEITPYDVDAMDGATYISRLAIVQAIVGDHDDAIDTLQLYFSKPGGTGRGYVGVDPYFDSLRHDPRFQRIVADR